MYGQPFFIPIFFFQIHATYNPWYPCANTFYWIPTLPLSWFPVCVCFYVDKYTDKEPSALDMFKETHFSNKKGFSLQLQVQYATVSKALK